MWNFRKLDVWKRALDLAENVYRVVDKFPAKENYALSGQLRRAVISISSNIAEGCGRRTSKDFVGFLHIAMGSTKEVESQLLVAERLGYLKSDEVENLIKELDGIGKMLNGLMGHVSGLGIK
jgi:four helix bundle protein